MNLLLDQNLSFKLVKVLTDVFASVKHVRALDLTESDDITIWEYAKRNGFLVVSQDADFAEMAALHGPPPKIVWLRCGNQPTAVIATLLREHAEHIAAFQKDPESACIEIYGTSQRTFV
jgi:predicted nuclease of predicted toxin-antitoxin system